MGIFYCRVTQYIGNKIQHFETLSQVLFYHVKCQYFRQQKVSFPEEFDPWSVFEEAWYNFYGQVIVLALFSWFSSRYIRDFPNVNELIKPSLEKRVTLPLKRGYPKIRYDTTELFNFPSSPNAVGPKKKIIIVYRFSINMCPVSIGAQWMH